MKHIHISGREKNIFIIATIAVTALFLYTVIFDGVIRKWSEADKDISNKRLILEKNISLLKNKDNVIEEYRSYSSSYRNMSKILSFLESQAKTFNIKVENIKPRPVAKKDEYKEYIIELQIEGSINDINNFMEELASPPIYITIDKVDIKAQFQNFTLYKGILILSKLII